MAERTGGVGRDSSRGSRKQKGAKEFGERLAIPSQGNRVALVRKKLGEIARDCGFSDSEVFDIKVAVGEACANAIEHGSPQGKENEVIIDYHVNDHSMVVEITDQGAFKPRFPTFDSRLNYRGRGLPFMLALMDDVEIKESETGTTVRLVKIHKS